MEEGHMFPAYSSPGYQPVLDKKENFRISGFDRSMGSSKFGIILQATWAILVARYNHDGNVIFGVTKSSTPMSKTQAIRVHALIDLTMTVDELLEVLGCQTRDVPDSTNASHIKSPFNGNASGEFRTLLGFCAQEDPQQQSAENMDPHGTENGVQLDNTCGHVALSIWCTEHADGVQMYFNFDSRIFNTKQIDRMAGHYEHVLQQMCLQEHRHMKLSSIDPTSAQDLRDIWEWNATMPKAVDTCVHDLLAETMRRQPEASAIYAWDGELTYGRLDEHSTILAHHLTSLGVGPEVTVPLCFEKSMWTPVAMLGVMKAGGASVMMDVTQPEKRLQVIVQQTNAKIILSSSANTKLATSLADRVVVVVDESNIAQLEVHRKDALTDVAPFNTLYIAYTSGSSGTPKGAILTHRNLASAIVHQRSVFNYSLSSRVFDFASYAFDVAWATFLRTIYAGGCLCIPSELDRKNDPVSAMKRLRVNCASITPTIGHLLDGTRLPHLDKLMLGGEAVSSPLISKLSSMASSIGVVYGPAECTPTSTYAEVQVLDYTDALIGSGIGIKTWIVDTVDEQRLAPVGTPGELWIEGPLVGGGYLHDPEKTAAAFVEDPPWLLKGTPEQPGRRGRLYRTGDLVRYNRNGDLTFLGRMDTQVKIHGQRVELGDVEQNMQRIAHAEVSADAGRELQVVAEVVAPLERSEAALIAFTSLQSTDNDTANGLKDTLHRMTASLADKLATAIPSHMVPTIFIPLEKIPTTTTSKTDHKKLRELAGSLKLEELVSLSTKNSEQRGPETEKERLLHRLCAQVLELSPQSISVDDSFLRIGGNSFDAMRLVGMARSCGLLFTVANVLQHPRLSDLANLASTTELVADEVVQPFSLLDARVDSHTALEQAAKLCTVEVDHISDILPCTQLQEGLLSMTARRTGDYVAQYVLELQPEVDSGRFMAAWDHIVATTPILRTMIVDIPNQGLVQVVTNKPTEWSRSSELKTLKDVQKLQAMDLGTALSRHGLAQVQSSGRNYFVWTVHHSLFDGWSAALLFDAVEHVYKGESTRPRLPFNAFVKYARNIDDTSASNFWRQYFDGLETHHYPNLPSPLYQPQADSVLTFKIADIEWPKHDFTVATAVRTAWAIVVAAYTRSNDAVFGVTVSGRHAAVGGIEEVIGPTIATVPIRVKMDDEKSVEELMRMVQTEAIAMTPFEQMGLLKIRRVSKAAQQACQFQSLLIVQPSIRPTQETTVFARRAQINKGDHESDYLGAFNTYAIMLESLLEKQGMHLRVRFDSTVLQPEQVEKIASQLEHVLRQVCTAEMSE